MYSVSNGSGRILAHQDDVQPAQPFAARRSKAVPVLEVVAHPQGRHAAPGFPVAQPDVGELAIEHVPAARLGGEQHGQGAVLGGLDVTDGVHHHRETHAIRH
jgi:hypothetical protein